MSDTIRTSFRTSLISSIIDNIYYNRGNYYFFIGKIDPWENETSPVEEIPITEEEDRKVRDGIVYVKKIQPNDISLLIPRYNWSPGLRFAAWDDTQDMTNKQFYCVTPRFEVFKCLDNAEGSISTIMPVKPVHTGEWSLPFRTSDGYTWKYMYDIPQYKRQKFITPNYIPVQRSLSNSFYNSGGIETVTVIDGGSGYTKDQQTQIVVSAIQENGHIISIDPFTNGIVSIELNQSIIGNVQYSSDFEIFIDSNGGSEAVLSIQHEIINGRDVITGINIDSSGFGYSVGDNVYITRNAILEPIVSQDTGSILDVIIHNPGSGYIVDPNDIENTRPRLIVTNPEGTGRGKYNDNQEAILIPIVDYIESSPTFGSIIDVVIEDPGVSYATNSSTNILVQGDGSGALLTPLISAEGSIVDVIVENPGKNYTYADLKIINRSVPESNMAILDANFFSGDFLSDQSIVEQLARLNSSAGSIYSIRVDVSGTGYTLPTQVIIQGDGFEATAHAVINQSDGSIDEILVDNPGIGYSQESTIITIQGQGIGAGALPVVDPETGSILAINLIDGGRGYSDGPIITIRGDGQNASARAIVNPTDGSISRVILDDYGYGYTNVTLEVEDWARINPNHKDCILRAVLPPFRNHGYNAVAELLSNRGVIYSVIQDEEVLNLIKQDYRQYGILLDPIDIVTDKLTRVNSESIVISFTVPDVTEITPDMILIHNNIRYRVVDINKSVVRLQQLSQLFKVPDLSSNHYFIDENDESNQFFFQEMNSIPTVDKYSGQLLYVSNSEAFIPNEDNIISIRTYITI